MNKNYAEKLFKKTQEDYSLIAERFSRARDKVWDEMRFLFDDYLVEGERILDLGCGNGRFYEMFKNKKIDYIGIDNSKELIEIAKKKFPNANFQVNNALNLSFPSDYFDKVYAVAVLHHIPSREFRLQFLKEAKRVLKQEGLLILTVWNLWQLKRTRKIIYRFALKKCFGRSKLDFKDILMKWEGAENCYFHCFDKKELEKLTREAGFKVKRNGEILVSSRKAKKSKWPNSNFYIVAEK